MHVPCTTTVCGAVPTAMHTQGGAAVDKKGEELFWLVVEKAAFYP